MRERQEPSRRIDDEDPPLGTAASTRRFARLVPSPATRRDALGRLGLVVLASTVALLMVVAAVVGVGRALVRWLHERPAYRIRFDQLTLEPEPPAWFVGGRAGFLDGLRDNARRPESLSVLDVDLDTLRDDFRHFAWVKKVHGIEKASSDRIIVRLEYREPVARWKGDPKIIIDGDGVILPEEDIQPEAAEGLIWLASVEHPPFHSRPGEPWKKGNAAEDLALPDERVRAAARLAGFLKARQAAEPIPALRAEKIHPMTEHAVSLEFDAQLIVFWGEPPGSERPGEPTASKSWDILRDHVRRHGALGVSDPMKAYLKITKGRLVEMPRPQGTP